jgi:hypothetical protein
MTPLDMAITQKNMRIEKTLLESMGNGNTENRTAYAPAQIAKGCGHVRMPQLLNAHMITAKKPTEANRSGTIETEEEVIDRRQRKEQRAKRREENREQRDKRRKRAAEAMEEEGEMSGRRRRSERIAKNKEGCKKKAMEEEPTINVGKDEETSETIPKERRGTKATKEHKKASNKQEEKKRAYRSRTRKESA